MVAWFWWRCGFDVDGVGARIDTNRDRVQPFGRKCLLHCGNRHLVTVASEDFNDPVDRAQRKRARRIKRKSFFNDILEHFASSEDCRVLADAEGERSDCDEAEAG